jgi:2-polyprenyl-3-methyl-5-hydroxy-6-metoxy-1,4-benzoquinol methylase
VLDFVESYHLGRIYTMNLMRSIRKRTTLLKDKTLLLKNRLLDPKGHTLTQESLTLLTQRDASKSIEADRCAEMSEYYGISEEEVQQIESITNKDALEERFNNIETDAGLFQNYRDAQLLYTGRMMVAYTRFRVAFSILKQFNKYVLPIMRPKTTVLDYGCGVGDYALAFATQGYRVRLCDIAGGNLDFAHWRFQQRKIPCEIIPVTEQTPYPDLGENQIILAGEVLEHVREPLTVLRNMHASLRKGDFLWHTGYPEHEREVGGDHLQEAADVRLEAQAFIDINFERITAPYLLGRLFQKR